MNIGKFKIVQASPQGDEGIKRLEPIPSPMINGGHISRRLLELTLKTISLIEIPIFSV
jgi:hypothetical protein